MNLISFKPHSILFLGKNIQKEDAISINSVELISGPSEALPRSGSVPSLDLKSFLPSNIEEDQVEAPQQVYISIKYEIYRKYIYMYVHIYHQLLNCRICIGNGNNIWKVVCCYYKLQPIYLLILHLN